MQIFKTHVLASSSLHMQTLLGFRFMHTALLLHCWEGMLFNGPHLEFAESLDLFSHAGHQHQSQGHPQASAAGSGQSLQEAPSASQRATSQ